MNESTVFRELISDVREQILYLQEIGVETLDAKIVESGKWKVESKPPVGAADGVISNLRSEISNFKSEIPKPPETRPAGQSRLASLPSLSNRNAAPDRHNSVPFRNTGTGGTDVTTEMEKQADTLFQTASTLPQPIGTIEQIRAEIGPDCTRCKLSTLGRSKVVNSVGNFNAELMFVGEAPGADEDAQGVPFVGAAGQLLNRIITACGMKREEVYICNILKCRPPNNRTPLADEAANCRGFLERQLELVKPKYIVALGGCAATHLLQTTLSVGKLRGRFHDYRGIPVMVTYHPAFLLPHRSPEKKREVWDDMKWLLTQMGRPIPQQK